MKKLLLLILMIFTLTACTTFSETPQDTQFESVEETNIENESSQESVEESEEETDVESEHETDQEVVETDEESQVETESEHESQEEPSEPNEMMNLVVYYVKDFGSDLYQVREVHQIEKTQSVATRAIEELISGDILTEGALRPLPDHAELIDISIKDGLATLNFTESVLDMAAGSSMEAQSLSAIANTLTEFPTIDRVDFMVNGSKEAAGDWWGHVGIYGREFDRSLSNVQEPVIWIENPSQNQIISDSIRISGSSIVFEATTGFTLEDSKGNILAQDNLPIEDIDGLRMLFDASYDIKTPASDTGKLSVYGYSGKDGSPVDVTSVNVRFE